MAEFTFDELSKQYKELSDLRKSGLNFNINVINSYDANGAYRYELKPKFNRIETVQDLATICRLNKSFISRNGLEYNQVIRSTIGNINLKKVTVTDSKILPNIRYFPNIIQNLYNVIVYYITEAPREHTIDGVTYRIVANDSSILCAADTDPMYNWLDKGHCIVCDHNFGKGGLFITNDSGLDTTYIISMFALDNDVVLNNIHNKVWLDRQATKISLLKMEKALHSRHQNSYHGYKTAILKDFEVNAQNVMVSRLMKGEIPSATFNDIKVSQNRASYETISIEAPNLMKIVFQSLDANQPFDIYTILGTYADHVTRELDSTALNENESGFVENKSFSMNINGFPVVAGVCTTNTRRQVNGNFINKDEIIPVIRRAACFSDGDEYNTFVKSVAKQSLDIHDILDRGLPMKVVINHYSEYSGEASYTHPKMFFKKEGSKYYLFLDAKQTRTVQLKRFVSFCDKVRVINRQTNGCYDRSYGVYQEKNGNWCIAKIKPLIREHVNDDISEEDLKALTDDVLNAFIEAAKEAQTKALARSEKLLADTVKNVGAERLENWRPGSSGQAMNGYKVKGTKRTYFVSDECKVYNHDTGTYVCIVNGSGDQGVGKDSLVARLLALKNDNVITQKISTLA
jgi:hypothetical protein